MSTESSGATFNEVAYQSTVQEIQEEFAMICLLVGFYGVLVVLSFLSIHAVLTQCNRKTRLTTIILSLTIFGLFLSTTFYAVIWLLSTQSSFLRSLVDSGVVLWSDSNIHLSLDSLYRVKDYTQLQYCAGTATLTVNITLGDAIVCWRACVVWYGNRAVRAVSAVFLLATFAMGVVDTNLGCNSGLSMVGASGHAAQPVMIGFMYQGFPGGIATCALSLTTNLVATLLVGYKAWESRKRLQGYLVAGPRPAQVEKLFALLIESGALYSALWVVIVGFQVGQYKFIQTADPSYQKAFFAVVRDFMNSALVPLIAIYPAIIIVLVALKRSHIERGFSHTQSLPTPHLTPLPVDTPTTSQRENRSSWMLSERLTINGQEFRHMCDLEDARGHIDEEGKTEGMISISL